MATVNVYSQYFEAEMVFNGVKRNAALVMLIADSDSGNIRYEAAVTFFPHNDPEDFGVSYDAYFNRILYDAKGRRSKKRDSAFLADFREYIDEVAKDAGGIVFWDKPLNVARYE